MSVKNRLSLVVGASLGISMVIALLWAKSNRTCNSPLATRTYQIYFKWNGEIQNLRLECAPDNREERQENIKAIVQKEASIEVRKVAVSNRWGKMSGSASVTVFGCAEPYVVKIADYQLPKLASLMNAAGLWNVNEIRKLLADGVDVNARDSFGHTPLMYAVADPRNKYAEFYRRAGWQPDIESIRTLLAAGADPNATDRSDLTVLMLAEDSTLEPLFAGGANVNLRNKNGDTALMYAARKCDNRAIEMEIAHGAEVNISNNLGWTPLMFAAERGCLTAIRLLLRAGADSTAKNLSGQNALALAKAQSTNESVARQAVNLLAGKSRAAKRSHDRGAAPKPSPNATTPPP